MRIAITRGRVGLAITLAVAVALAGCGSDDDDPDNSADNSANQSPAASSPSTPPSTGTSPGGSDSQPTDCQVHAGTANAAQPPWPAPQNAVDRMHAACLEPLTAEGQVVHIHALLIVYVDGQPQAVPANIGIDEAQRRISALHTHDTTGVVHIESPVQATFTLGQLFTEWDVKLTADAIGGFTADSSKTLRWWVNGQPQQGNPADLTFEAHQIIVLAYGDPQQNVDVPTTYDWGNL